MSAFNHSGRSSGGPRRLTEGEVLEELGLDRLELYLLVCAERLGDYDSISHLLVFSEGEVDALAARLSLKRRKPAPPDDATLARIPEPSSE